MNIAFSHIALIEKQKVTMKLTIIYGKVAVNEISASKNGAFFNLSVESVILSL